MAGGDVSNDMGGTVHGALVQAGRIDQVVLPPASEAVVVPRQLPAAVPDFCGRGNHLAALDALLAGVERDAGGGAVVVAGRRAYRGSRPVRRTTSLTKSRVGLPVLDSTPSELKFQANRPYPVSSAIDPSDSSARTSSSATSSVLLLP